MFVYRYLVLLHIRGKKFQRFLFIFDKLFNMQMERSLKQQEKARLNNDIRRNWIM